MPKGRSGKNTQGFKPNYTPEKAGRRFYEKTDSKSNYGRGYLEAASAFLFFHSFRHLFQQLYNTADAVIVGNFVGKEALAAVGGPAATLINLLVGFFVGLSSGATVIISQFYGAKNNADVKKAVHTSIALSLAGGAIIAILGLIFFRRSPAAHEYAR